MIRLLLSLSAFALFCTSAAAENSGQSFWYGEIRGGAVFALDSNEDLFGLDTEISLDPGWLAEVTSGFAHGSGWRGELAVGYRNNDLDQIKISPLPGVDLSGDIWSLTTMVNGYYDLHFDRLGLDGMFWSRLTPFVGGGVGAAFIEIDGDLGDENHVAFAWQGIGGLSYDFNSRWLGTLSYNYFSALDPKFDGVGFDYDSHNVIAGMRFRF